LNEYRSIDICSQKDAVWSIKHYGDLFWEERAAMTKRLIIFDKALWSISRQGLGGVSRNPSNVNWIQFTIECNRMHFHFHPESIGIPCNVEVLGSSCFGFRQSHSATSEAWCLNASTICGGNDLHPWPNWRMLELIEEFLISHQRAHTVP
jgi:hypothetical protein